MRDQTQRARYSPEVRERAVRMVMEHGHEYASQSVAIMFISGKTGYAAQTLQPSAL